MKNIKKNFTDYGLLLLKAFGWENITFSLSRLITGCADMFCTRSGVSQLPASYFVWVVGGGSSLHQYAVISVKNLSPLTYEIY